MRIRRLSVLATVFATMLLMVAPAGVASSQESTADEQYQFESPVTTLPPLLTGASWWG